MIHIVVDMDSLPRIRDKEFFAGIYKPVLILRWTRSSIVNIKLCVILQMAENTPQNIQIQIQITTGIGISSPKRNSSSQQLKAPGMKRKKRILLTLIIRRILIQTLRCTLSTSRPRINSPITPLTPNIRKKSPPRAMLKIHTETLEIFGPGCVFFGYNAGVIGIVFVFAGEGLCVEIVFSCGCFGVEGSEIDFVGWGGGC
jgi:hypothetical protein